MTTGYPVPNDDRAGDWRELTRDLADLCKRDGAVYAVCVRTADGLQAEGWERMAAYSEALHRVLNAERPPSP